MSAQKINTSSLIFEKKKGIKVFASIIFISITLLCGWFVCEFFDDLYFLFLTFIFFALGMAVQVSMIKSKLELAEKCLVIHQIFGKREIEYSEIKELHLKQSEIVILLMKGKKTISYDFDNLETFVMELTSRINCFHTVVIKDAKGLL